MKEVAGGCKRPLLLAAARVARTGPGEDLRRGPCSGYEEQIAYALRQVGAGTGLDPAGSTPNEALLRYRWPPGPRSVASGHRCRTGARAT
jgi:hypothetical protein